MYHYVYRITNKIIHKHYYGVRSTKINPKDDLGEQYFSSSTDKMFINDQKKNPTHYRYKIIKFFPTRIDALRYEILLHAKFNVCKNVHFYNKANQSNTKFSAPGMILAKNNGKWEFISVDEYYDKKLSSRLTGKTTVIDSIGNTMLVSVNDPRYISGELKHAHTGKVNAINERGIYEQVSVDDYHNRKLTCNNTGKVPVIDQNGKGLLVSIDDQRYLDGELKHCSAGLVSAYNLISQSTIKVSKEEYDSNPNLVGVNKNKISGSKNPNAKEIGIFDSNGFKIYHCVGNFKAICKINNLPFVCLRTSYLNEGEPIYQKPANNKKHSDDFKGWFARILS